MLFPAVRALAGEVGLLAALQRLEAHADPTVQKYLTRLKQKMAT